MTEEEMKARIAELEAEVASLKQSKTIRRSRLPMEWIAEHPIIDPKYGNDANAVGAFIRRTIFSETVHDEYYTSCGYSKSRKVCIDVNHMTDEQYAIYIETFENVLKCVLTGRKQAAEQNCTGGSV